MLAESHGKYDDANAIYDEILEAEPAHAVSQHVLAWGCDVMSYM